ncbi:glutathione peroxidase [Marinomonas posidonica]|uniref:Glutathione peroxidase n=1 Tax=Marinomonas posidonica (strain CECT 7376 / NCIMB 14433 / IVIA-Po-181) TaxID=491952 RepID=F6CYJ7_MARPP|nr:glutathione peroxidase [Marinomonas posidonica]AEF54606.1 Peroxiredoxin [Marinomonas posidonica IVIA-Po-181]
MSAVLNHTVNNIQGEPVDLSRYQGKTLLLVNVASKCGLTPQYEGLEALYKKYHEQGFEILGFPANDFAGQEPGSNEEIQQFCSLTYDVTFPMFSKLVVTGEDKHPLYQDLIKAVPVTPHREGMENMLKQYDIEPTAAPEVVWNFEKFLIRKNGDITRFAPDTTPDNETLVSAIEADL